MSVYGESVGGCSGLTVQVEVFGLDPCLNTVATDADGDIALQDDSLFTRMVMSSMHLLVKDKLDEIPESDLFI